MEFLQYEKFLNLFSSIDLKDEMKINFHIDNIYDNKINNNINSENTYQNQNQNKYQCNILIYLFRNLEKIENYFSIDYLTNKSNNNNNNNFNSSNGINFNFDPSGGLLANTKIPAIRNISIPYKPAFRNTSIPYKPAFRKILMPAKSLNFAPRKAARNFINIFENNLNDDSYNSEDEINNKNNKDIIDNFEINQNDIMNLSIFTGKPFGKFLLDLISLGCDINQKDTNGKDILFHCITQNNFELIKFLFLNFGVQIKSDNVDKYKKGLIHYVINPFYENSNNNNDKHTNNYSYSASFENTLILKYLITKGVKYDLIDIYGKSPIDYAIERKSKVLINYFEELNLITKEEIENKRNNTILNKDKNKNNYNNYNNDDIGMIINDLLNENNHNNDYHKDAEILIKENLLKGKNILKREIIPDPIGRFDNKKK